MSTYLILYHIRLCNFFCMVVDRGFIDAYPDARQTFHFDAGYGSGVGLQLLEDHDFFYFYSQQCQFTCFIFHVSVIVVTGNCHDSTLKKSTLWIRDILVRIRILLFSSVTFKMQTKKFLLTYYRTF
jgi:hypothetical protein